MKLEPVAWDDRPLIDHIMECINATCSAWSDVRDVNGNLIEWKCQLASALEHRLRTMIKDALAIPEGYVLVPVEPTDEKLNKAWRDAGLFDGIERFRVAFRLLTAAKGE